MSQVGNMMKTIMARTSRVKDPDVSAEDKSKASEALASIGINIWDDKTGEYQNFGKTLDQLSEKWANLSDAQKAFVGESMAGTRGQNVFMNMVESWNEAKGLVKQVEEDPNYYLEVQEKGMDSLQSKMDSLKASMQNFWYNLLDAGAIGEGIQLITGLTNAIGDLLSKIKLLPMVGNTLGVSTVGGIGIVISQMFDSIKKTREEMKNNGEVVGLFGGVKSGIKNTFSELNTLGLKGSSVLKDGETAATITSLFAEGKQASGLAGGIKNVWANMTGLSKAVVGTVGAFAALEAASVAFDAMTESSQETKEKINELTIAQNKNAEKVKTAEGAVKSYGAEWERLKEGVNDDGTNNSLTTEEFARFQELSNQIAQVFPSLVQGFDASGNAIIKAETSLKDLNAQLEILKVNTANENIGNFNDYLKGFQDLTNRSAGTEFADGWKDQLGAMLRIDSAEVGKSIEAGEAADILKELSSLNSIELQDKMRLSTQEGGYNDFMKSYLYSLGLKPENISKNFAEVHTTIMSEMNRLQADIEAAAMPVRQNLQDYLTVLTHNLKTGELNEGISQDLVNNLNAMIGNISVDQLKQLDKLGIDMQEYVANILGSIQGDAVLQQSLDTVMSVNKDSSFADIENAIASAERLGDSLKDISREDIFEMMNVNAKEIHDRYQDIIKDVNKQDKSEKKVKKTLRENKKLLDDFIDKNEINSEAELDKLKSLINKSDTWQDVLNSWALESLDFDNIDSELESLEANLTTVKNAFEKLNQAIQESNSSSGMSSESINNLKSMYSGLEGYDADKLFEATYSGVHANTQELAKLTKEYKETNYKKYTDEMSKLEQQYTDLTQSITKSQNASEKNKKIAEREKIKEKITDLELLQSQYEGLTNAVNLWQQAQSRGDEGDLYESVRGGFDEAKKMYDEGWIGDDRFQAFTQMFSKEDLSGAGSDVFEKVFQDNLPRMERWFADGQEGIKNFTQDIAAMNEGLVDAQGNIDFSKMPSMDTLAEQLGVDKSLIDTMFKAMNRAGADLDFSEATDRLRGLRDEVKSLGEGLDAETKEKYSLNLDAGKGIEDGEELTKVLTEERDKAEALKKELIDVGKKGSKEFEYVSKQADYFNARLGEIEVPKIDFESPEGIEELTNELNVLNKVSNVELEIDWKNQDAGYYTDRIAEVDDAIKKLQGENGKIDIATEGVAESLDVLTALQQKQWELNSNNNLRLNIDTSQLSGEVQSAVNALIDLQDQAQLVASMQHQMDLGFEVKGFDDAKGKLNEMQQEFANLHPTTTGQLKIEGLGQADADMSALAAKLTSLEADTTLVKIGVDSALVDGYQASEHDAKGTVHWNNNTSLVDQYARIPKTASGTVYWTNKETNARPKGGGVGGLNGNAHVNGTASLWQRGKAFAKGTWGAAKSTMALTGELGR